jgi:hypothetical protein
MLISHFSFSNKWDLLTLVILVILASLNIHDLWWFSYILYVPERERKIKTKPFSNLKHFKLTNISCVQIIDFISWFYFVIIILILISSNENFSWKQDPKTWTNDFWHTWIRRKTTKTNSNMTFKFPKNYLKITDENTCRWSFCWFFIL